MASLYSSPAVVVAVVMGLQVREDFFDEGLSEAVVLLEGFAEAAVDVG